MTTELYDRIGELRGEIDRARGEDREALLDRLEEAVAALRLHNAEVPGWAESRLAARVDAQLEDQFDNMPV